MAEPIPFRGGKTAASKARVAALMRQHRSEMSAAQEAADALAETDRIRKIVLTDLGLAFQKGYVLLGAEEMDKLGPWLQSAKREEFLLKQRIKGG